MTTTFESRVAGVVLGTAVGDALGAPVEFQKVRGGSRVVSRLTQPGQYTDDTQLTVAVMRGLMDAHKIMGGRGDPGLVQYVNAGDTQGMLREEWVPGICVAERFAKWKQRPEEGTHRAPGAACLNGISNYQLGTPWFRSGGVNSGGCGAVMRSAPYGLWYLDHDAAVEVATQHSLITHAHPGSLAAVAGLVSAVHRLVAGENRDIAVDSAIKAARAVDAKTGALVEQARTWAYNGKPPADVLEVFQGWNAWEALAGSVYCWLRSPDFPEAVLNAVNSPGDSDSLGAITGALVGAELGIEAIPTDWARSVERSSALVELSMEFAAMAKHARGAS